MIPKSILKLLSAPKLGGLQGTLWGAFGIHFGLMLKLSELIFELVGSMLASFSSFAFRPPGPQL